MTKAERIKEIDMALDEVRPHLKVDGGDVEIVDLDLDKMIVTIKWLGSCVTCAMSDMTLAAGVASAIKARIPEIKDVVPINGFTTNTRNH